MVQPLCCLRSFNDQIPLKQPLKIKTTCKNTGKADCVKHQANHLQQSQTIGVSKSFLDLSSVWWLTYPSEKYESQLGWWHSQYMESHKIHVPNHQPVMIYPIKIATFMQTTGWHGYRRERHHRFPKESGNLMRRSVEKGRALWIWDEQNSGTFINVGETIINHRFGNGNHTTYKNCDLGDLGGSFIVYGIVLTTLH